MSKELLGWWLGFAQFDLGRAYNKTKLRLHDELEHKLQAGSKRNCLWKTETFDLSEMKEFQDGAMEIVEALKDMELPRPGGRVVTKVTMSGISSCSWVSTREKKETAKGIMLQALADADIQDYEQFGRCLTCGNLFLQVSPKRKKLFCRTQCKTKFYKEEKNGSNNEKT